MSVCLSLSGGGGRLLSGRLSEGWECLRHRVLRHGPLQLRFCLWAPYHAATRPPGRKPSHHPRGQQEWPGPVQRSRCRRWGSAIWWWLMTDWCYQWNLFSFCCFFFPEGRACAVVFDCKFIETSASLQHNVAELFEGVVRQIRLRRDGSEAAERRRSIYKRKESLTQKARRFLDRLVARNNQRMAVKARSKSCHDLAVLWRHLSDRRLDLFWLAEVLSGCDIADDDVYEPTRMMISSKQRTDDVLYVRRCDHCDKLVSLFGLMIFFFLWLFPPDELSIKNRPTVKRIVTVGLKVGWVFVSVCVCVSVCGCVRPDVCSGCPVVSAVSSVLLRFLLFSVQHCAE